MAKKATKAQNLQRMRVVYEMLLSDTPRPDVLQYAAKNWGIATRTTDMLIQKANNLIGESINDFVKAAIEFMLHDSSEFDFGNELVEDN